MSKIKRGETNLGGRTGDDDDDCDVEKCSGTSDCITTLFVTIYVRCQKYFNKINNYDLSQSADESLSVSSDKRNKVLQNRYTGGQLFRYTMQTTSAYLVVLIKNLNK